MLKSVLSAIPAFLLYFNVVAQNQNETIVNISTSFGNIKIKLYNETPIHRDNFIKLVKEGKFNGTTFHRIINTHLIQGRTTDDAGNMEFLPSEIVPGKFHKRGAVAAVQQDVDNPEKKTSATQFYITLGNAYAYELMDRIGNRMGYKFSEEQKQTYSTAGGIPTLDGINTVFGEVIEGLDIVEKIASSKVSGETPLEKIEVKMSISAR